MAIASYFFPAPLSGISKRFASENLLRAPHPTCFHSYVALRKVPPLSCSSFSIRGRMSNFPCSSTVVFGARSELNGSEEGVDALDFFTNVKHVLFPITDQNPYLSDGTKQAAVTTTTLAKKYGADITVVVIDEKPKESIPEHDARLTSIRWHLSEGGFKEFGLIERLGEGKKPTADPSRFSKINVEGLKNVLQACKENETIQKIIYTSSFFALGCTDGYVADENQVHDEKFFCTEYERSKAIADKIARESASDGLPLVLVYPGVIYGQGKITAGNLVARLMIERFNGRLPGYVGDGTDKVSFSHVEDVAMGHIAAMHKGRVGERYLLTGDNASMTLLFDAAAILTKMKKPWFHIPIWVLNIYGYMSVIIARITGKLPLVSHPTARVLRHQWAYSCDKAKKELDYNPRNLNEGLSETLSWLKKDGLIKY